MSHSVPLLRKVGLPAQAGIRVNSANHGNGSFSYLFNGTTGSQKVGGRSKTFNTGATVAHFLMVLQIYQEISVTKIPETFRLKSRFKHTVSYLKKMGIPANNSIQV